ncbi:MAG: TonB-dependent receptor, partial [Paraprevotella sp.]|nr:TonB-dependent receptor [Paraprevotella sp.]
MKFLVTIILFLSVQTLSAQTTNNNDSIDINKLYKNLPEVVVKAEKPIVKIVQGKMVYNMPNLLEKLPADNAYEALTHIPGVSDATGRISFSGNEVTLIINGQATTLTQEQLTERLKAMPAAQLAKAEVMLAAPARYHVRGMAINIVTKDYAGTNQLSGQIIGGLQQSKYAKGF